MLGTKYEAQQKVDVEPKLTWDSCGKWLQSLSSSFGQVIQFGISVSVKFVGFALEIEISCKRFWWLGSLESRGMTAVVYFSWAVVRGN